MVSVTLLPPAPTTVDCRICSCGNKHFSWAVKGQRRMDIGHPLSQTGSLRMLTHHRPGHTDDVVAFLWRQEIVIHLGPVVQQHKWGNY